MNRSTRSSRNSRARRPLATVLVCALCLILAEPLLAVGGVFAQCKILDRLENRSIAILDAGRNQGLELRDPAVLLSDGRLSATGHVFYLEPGLCAVRLGWQDPTADAANAGVVVSQALANVCRIALPPRTTITDQPQTPGPPMTVRIVAGLRTRIVSPPASSRAISFISGSRISTR